MATTLTTIDHRQAAEPVQAPGYRQPPNNVEAEMGLLGAILENNAVYDRVSDFLLPEHFFDAAHGSIFAACRSLIERDKQADPTTLKHVFEAPEFEKIGGHRYLAELAGASFAIINARTYGELIHDLHLRRRLIELGTDVVNDAFSRDPDDKAMEQIEAAEQRLFNLAQGNDVDGGFSGFADVLSRAIDQARTAYEREGRGAGASTRFHQLDRLLGGLQKSDLIVLAGRPAMGKTALATNIAFNIATRPDMTVDENGDEAPVGSPVVGFFSLEMSSEQLATRILAEAATLSSHKIRQGEMTQPEFDQLVRASWELQAAPLYIDDTPALAISALRARARRLARQPGGRGLGLIVVDYLQLLRASPASAQQGRVHEISEITRGLKALAKELDVPVLALSQLSRAVEQREDKRPQLADLRESGTIEQDADVVIFIYREEYYLNRQEPSQRADEGKDKFDERQRNWREASARAANKAELIVAKQRHGPTGTVELRFYPEATKFDNLEDGPPHPDGPPPAEPPF